jgi:hypothetical protein
MYGKPEPGKKLFREVSESDHQEKVLKGIAFGIVVAGLLCVLFLLVIPAFEHKTKEVTSEPEPAFTGPPLTFLKCQLIPGRPAYVECEAQNIGPRTLEYVEVFADFYDAKGQRVGQGLSYTANLLPGQFWQFRIYCLKCGWEASQAKVKVGFWRFK